jgi:uncharacterized membrane protein YeaQ/YmgE (transglycosylase-associated protein family)
MNWIWFLVVGGLAGWLAGKIMRGRGFGIVGDIIVGIVGGVVGGFLFGALGLVSIGLLGSLLSATAGAVVLIFVVRLLKSV